MGGSGGGSSSDKKSSKKRSMGGGGEGHPGGGGSQKSSPNKDVNLETGGIKFPDYAKSVGVTLRSQRMKLPPNVGTKKVGSFEQMLGEAGVDPAPAPSDKVCTEFNELRSDMVLLYELKNALATCDQELHSLKAQYENMCPGKTLEIPEKLRPPTSTILKGEKVKNISDAIDVVGNGPTPPIRKRKAALEQVNIMKKIKGKHF